jgi:prefoldin subunit 5
MLVPAQASANLQTMAEALLAEHKTLRGEIVELRQRSAQLPDSAAVEAIAKAGQDLQRRLDSLELWLTRLDDKLAQVAAPASAQGRRRLDVWQAVLIALLIGALGVAGTIMLLYSGS